MTAPDWKWTSADLQQISSFEILNALADGAYVTNTDRSILFWNKAAEHITGWSAGDVVGRSCQDNILVHIDKDGHPLCGREYCPLHRSIVTGQSSAEALLVFAQHKDGRRVPVEVSVAPIRDRDGQIVGGIEVFRDLTAGMSDLVRARLIQENALHCGLCADARVEFDVRYVPNEIVGGDFYRVERLDADRYAVMIADVMGHGVAAALYTMQLRTLWDDGQAERGRPGEFVRTMNRRLHELTHDAGYFATAFYLTINVVTGLVEYVRAGHPSALVLRGDGSVERLAEKQPALGMFPDAEYRSTTAALGKGETLLLYTDGAVEVAGADGAELGTEGLEKLISVPAAVTSGRLDLARLEEQLLKFSQQIRLADDLTLLTVHRR